MVHTEEPADWTRRALPFVKECQRTGTAPLKHSVPGLLVRVACCPAACLPCIVWSTVVRAVFCPWQASTKGCAFACFGNGLTKRSDKCLTSCCDYLRETGELPALRIPRILMPDDTKGINDIVDLLEEIFTTNKLYTRTHYILAETIVTPLAQLAGVTYEVYPSAVLDVIAAIKIRL